MYQETQTTQTNSDLPLAPIVEVRSDLPILRPDISPTSSRSRALVPLLGLFLALLFLSGWETSLSARSLLSQRVSIDSLSTQLANVWSARSNDVLDGWQLIKLNILTTVQTTQQNLISQSWNQVVSGVVVYEGLSDWLAFVQNRHLYFLDQVDEGVKQQVDYMDRSLALASRSMDQTSLALQSNLNNYLSSWWVDINRGLFLVYHNTEVYLSMVADRWRAFLASDNQQNLDVDLEALRQQIKQEILAELNSDIQSLVASGLLTQPTLVEGVNGQGVVVVPSTELLTPAEIKTQIATLFSDPVDVRFDASGQSGIVTPIFKNQPGDDYIFVLTPIRRQ